MSLLRAAMATDRVLTIRYNGVTNPMSLRELQPLKWVNPEKTRVAMQVHSSPENPNHESNGLPDVRYFKVCRMLVVWDTEDARYRHTQMKASMEIAVAAWEQKACLQAA